LMCGTLASPIINKFSTTFSRLLITNNSYLSFTIRLVCTTRNLSLKIL
jgi:hypothetical protein